MPEVHKAILEVLVYPHRTPGNPPKIEYIIECKKLKIYLKAGTPLAALITFGNFLKRVKKKTLEEAIF